MLSEKARKRISVALCIAVIFLVLGIASLFVPLYGQVCGPSEQTGHYECNSNHLVLVWLWHFGKILDATSAFVTALATALLTAITYYLWKLEGEAGDTNKAQLRAYVSAKARAIMWDGEFLRVFVQIQNSGQTPAFNVKIPAVWEIKPNPPKPFYVADMGLSDEHLAQLASVTLPKDGSQTLSPKSKIVDLKKVRTDAASGTFYVYGLITYKDIFGDTQWVEFCFFLDGRDFIDALIDAQTLQGRMVDVAFKAPSFGNDASFSPDYAEGMKKYREQQRTGSGPQ